jgi:diguanylate cyclase (GGDEF)-like protein
MYLQVWKLRWFFQSNFAYQGDEMIDAKIIPQLLEKSSLFRGIPQKILAPVFRDAVQISLYQGEQLLAPGSVNEYVYIIISGQLGVHLTLSNLDEPLAVLNPGECVGEMSVLVDSDVSAYVLARIDCQLLAIGYSSFWALIKGSNDSARNMLNILVQRIRMGNEVIADTLLHHDKDPARKAVIDSITGLYNQHGMRENFGRVRQLYPSGKLPIFLILLKIDDAINTPAQDGELRVEQALRRTAQTILTLLRPGDYAARLSADTLAILQADLTYAEVYAAIEALRVTISQTPIRLPDGSALPAVTISAGICKAKIEEDWSVLVAEGELALQRAVQSGGNCISD